MVNLEVSVGVSGSAVDTSLSLTEVGKFIGLPIAGCTSF